MGFSLLELLVALSITAILMLAGIPALNTTTERVTMQTLHEQWLTRLYQIKAHAMRENRSLTLNVSQYWQRIRRPGWQLQHNFNETRPLRFEGSTGYARAGSLQLNSTNLTVRIIISGLGRIRACQQRGPQLADMAPC